MDWQQAVEYCAELSIDDHSDWRLPTISELRSLIRGCTATETGGSCGVSDSCLDYSCWDDSCQSCDYEEGPANGYYWPDGMNGEYGLFWSSSSAGSDDAWYVHFSYGNLYHYDKSYYHGTCCVRSGQ